MWSQVGLIRHPGLKAQVYVVCDKTKLVGVLYLSDVRVTLPVSDAHGIQHRTNVRSRNL